MSYSLFEFLCAILGISFGIMGKFEFSLCLKESSVPAFLITGSSLFQSRIVESRKNL